MSRLVLLLPFLAFTAGIAYAEPLGNIQTTVLEHVDNTATIQITWDADPMVSSYKIGCVSCFPHIVETTTENRVVLGNVTSFPNSPFAMLYGIAYDFEEEIISAKQIFVDLTK